MLRLWTSILLTHIICNYYGITIWRVETVGIINLSSLRCRTPLIAATDITIQLTTGYSLPQLENISENTNTYCVCDQGLETLYIITL